MKKILFYFIFILVASVHAADKLPPDPNQLTPGWWSYFEENPKETTDKINAFEESLKSLVGKMKGLGHEKAETNLETLHINLQAYLAAFDLKDPPCCPLTPIAKHYSLDHTLEIYRAVKKHELDLKAYSDQLTEKQKQLSDAQSNIDRLSVAYAKAPERSEEKINLALELISNQAAFEAAKRNIAHISVLIDQENKQLQSQKDELEGAINRITINHMDLKKLSHAVGEAEQNWTKEKKLLEEKEQEHLPQTQADASEIAEAQHQKNLQDLIHHQIREAAARQQFNNAQIMFTLARVIEEPKSVDTSTLRSMETDWNRDITAQRERVDAWSESIRKLFLRYTQIVTMGDSGNKNAQEIAMVQKDVIQQARGNFMLLQSLGNTLDDNSFLLDEVDHRVTSLLGTQQRYLMDLIDFSNKSWHQARDWLNTPFIHINEKPITTFSILEFLLVMLMAVWISRFIAKALTQFSMTRQGIHKSLVYKITRLVKYLILTFGLLIALSMIGFDFSSLLLIAGALGVGLGFGLQSIFNNFVSGLIILFESHLKVGDIIEVSGVKGEVREINVRSTIMTTGEGSEVIIPNSELISSKVVNWTMNDSYRKLHLPFTVASDSDKEVVAKVVEEAAAKVKSSIQQAGVTAPRVSFMNFGDNGMNMELTVWFDQRFTSLRGTTSDYLWAIDDALRDNGIRRPNTELDVKIVK